MKLREFECPLAHRTQWVNDAERKMAVKIQMGEGVLYQKLEVVSNQRHNLVTADSRMLNGLKE